MTQTAYLAPPSMSFTTLFTNLPALLNTNQHPIILMDSYDLKRLQGRVVRERGNREVQIRGAVCDLLLRRGIIRGIDYASYYPVRKQNRYLQHYQDSLEALPDHVLQNAVSDSAEIFTRINRGDYQKPFRVALGNWDLNIGKRRQISNQRQKFDRGLGDPALWHERVFGKYMAALEVKYWANRDLDYNIVSVLGQGDREGISKIVHSSEMEFDDAVLSMSPNDQIEQIGRPNPDHAAALHKKLAAITDIAREATGTQHNDWYVLGSRLAVPLFSDLLTKTHGLNGRKWDPDSIVEEIKQVLAYLEKEAADNQPAHLRYEAERIIEHSEDTNQTTGEIAEQLASAADLSNHARDIRALAKEKRFSPTALFVAASIKMDPNYRYNEDDLYRKAGALKRRLRSVNVSDAEIESFSRRGSFRLGGKGKNWHQTIDRQRQPIRSYR